MPTQGPSGPSSGGNDATVGSTAWVNPGNVTTQDGVFTTASTPVSLPATSEYLTATNFGFTIPAGATVNAIKVEWKLKGSAVGVVTDNSVVIIKGGTVGGTDQSAGATWSTTNGFVAYGDIVSNLWGLTWLPADINASNFGAAISAAIGATPAVSNVASVDYCQITVAYTAAIAGTSGQPTIAYQTNYVQPAGGVIAFGAPQPYVPPTGSILPKSNVARAADPPLPAGSVIQAGRVAPSAPPPSASLSIAQQAAGVNQTPQQGFATFTQAVPLTPIRPVGTVASELPRPGDAGGWRASSSYWPVVPPSPLSLVVADLPRPLPPGSAQAFAYPGLPSVPVPTNAPQVVRDVFPPMPPGSVTTIQTLPRPDPLPLPRVVARQPEPEPAFLAGYFRATSTYAPPEPGPTPSVVATYPQPMQAGGWLFEQMVSLAAPPGALVPRPAIARTADPPGFPGLAVAFHSAWDYTLPELVPIFLSSESPVYYATAASGFNTGKKVGVPVFVARRVP